MTTENALSSQGVEFQIGDGASPEVFTAVAEVTNINAFTGQTNMGDASHLKSTYAQKIAGIIDEGQTTLELNFYPDNSGLSTLETNRENRTKDNYRIVVKEGSPEEGYEFAAFVVQASYNASVNEAQTASVTLDVSGGRSRL